MPHPPRPLLAAPDPAAWLATHLVAQQSAHDGHHPADGGQAGEPRRVTIADVLADDAARLRREHDRLVTAENATPAAAAKWLTGWFAGGVAQAAGFVHAAASAAVLLRADEVRFRLHPDGWPDRCELGAAPFAVVAGHPWAGHPRVRVVAHDDALASLAVAALTETVTPLVEACRGLAKVGRAALWAEVVDGFGLPVLHQLDLPVDPSVVARLAQAVRAPGRPWRQLPDLRTAETPAGPAYLGRKAGCCLAYQCPAEPDPAEPDERHRAYLRRFPPGDGPRYCSACSLRDLAGCEERQVFWLEQERAERAATVT